MTLQNIQSAIQQVKKDILCHYPDWISISSYIPMIADLRVTELGETDGDIIKFGAKFSEASPNFKMFSFLHLVLHCALRHPVRGNEIIDPIDKQIWELATDIRVNEFLKPLAHNTLGNFDLIRTPEEKSQVIWYEDVREILEEVSYVERDFTAEGLFNSLKRALKDDIETQLIQSFLDRIGSSFVEPYEDASEIVKAKTGEDLSNLESLKADQWKQRISTLPGNSPGSLSSNLLQSVYTPKVNWRIKLKRYLTPLLRSPKIPDYTRPNRRCLIGAQLYYSPSYQPNPGIKHLVLGIDLSGSCYTGTIFTQFISHIDSIIQINCPKVTVLTFDTEVHDRITLPPKTKLSDLLLQGLALTGNGGTSFVDVLAEINTLNPTVAIIFTDGDGEYPDQPPKSPLIWATTHTSTPWSSSSIITLEEDE